MLTVMLTKNQKNNKKKLIYVFEAVLRHKITIFLCKTEALLRISKCLLAFQMVQTLQKWKTIHMNIWH